MKIIKKLWKDKSKYNGDLKIKAEAIIVVTYDIDLSDEQIFSHKKETQILKRRR